MHQRHDLEQVLFQTLYRAGVNFSSNEVIPKLADAVEHLYAQVPPASPLPLDPEPWEEQGDRSKYFVGAYLPTGQLPTVFAPREKYEQNPVRYLQEYSRKLWK